MDITLPPEILAGLIAAMMLALLWFVRHLTSFAKALQRHAEVNAALNDELLANIKERRKEREECNAERAAITASMSQERETHRTDMQALRDASETANRQLSQELIKVKQQLARTEAELLNLKRQYEQETHRLQERVTMLEAENGDKESRIDLLKAALEQSECDRNKLESRLQTLRETVNGKLDKPSTDDLTAVIQQVTAGEGDDDNKTQES